MKIITIKGKIIRHKKGDIKKFITKKSKEFKGFGECYFSEIKKNQIKGWKKHNKMKMNLIVPLGKVEFRFYSEKENEYKNVVIGENNYKRLFVPNGIWFAFKGHNKKNMVINLSNIIHTKNEASRRKLNFLKFYD